MHLEVTGLYKHFVLPPPFLDPETARNGQKQPGKSPPESFNICVAKKCRDPKLVCIDLPRSFYKRELSSVYVTTT
jgi:hypothetical protein